MTLLHKIFNVNATIKFGSHLPKSFVLFASKNPFKNDEKCFLFPLESLFKLCPDFMVIQEKCFSCYILLTDKVSLSACLYFLRYQERCVFRFFVSHVVRSQTLKLTKKSRQKFKYLENKISFSGEKKGIFHHF